ncbi:MAG TPA: beta-propeller fold lactonase family protein, partial [Usitatibacter sp.]|nr:beta-propeller fold lactonase family protein [Usitatibacter sp.]
MILARTIAAAAALAITGALAAPFAYVSNEGSGTISVIDTATDTVVRTITAGEKPRGITTSRDGSRVFVTEQAANALVAYDTASGERAGTVPVGRSPEATYLSPDGRTLSVAVEENDQIALVDAAALKLERAIP